MRRIAVLALAALLSVSMFGLLTACGKGANDIKSITTGEIESNGVDVKVYRANLKDTVDWAAISEGDREKIAVAAFNEAQKKIAEDNVFNYQIIGITATEEVAFSYSGEKQTLIIRVGDEQVGEVAVEVPNR
jgi:hypothetical protein